MSNSSSPSETDASPPPPSSSESESPPSSGEGSSSPSPPNETPPSPSGSSSESPPSSSNSPPPPSSSDNSPPSSESSPGSSSQSPPSNNGGSSSDRPSRDDSSPSPPDDWFDGNDSPTKDHSKSHHKGNQDSESNSSGSRGNSSSGVIVGLALVGIVVLLAIIFFVARSKKKKLSGMEKHYIPPTNTNSGGSDGYYYRHSTPFANSNNSGPFYAPTSPMTHSGQFDPTGSKSWFTYEELADATHGFSRENLIGEGGFGCVFKGWLPDGRCVAVKQLKAGSGQGEREFQAEVEIISRVHHRHLVSLVGYCIAEYHRLLVYEFVPNGTLEHHLHGKGVLVMDWPKRMRIAIGSARGLAYLHEDCHPRIIHRDIKSANILIDNEFEAQVADFGLAKPSNDMNTHVSTRIMGTFGYLAPEYASSGKLTDRSDVFSFGVVLLEIITGRKPVDPTRPLGDESLVEWSRPLLLHALQTGDFGVELVDTRLEGNFDRKEMLKMMEVAAGCTRHSAPKRPRMVQVARSLDSVGDVDLSNGVRYGDSTVYNSDKYNDDIQKFRRMALGDDDYSGEYGQSGNMNRRSSAFSCEMYSQDGQLPRPSGHPSQYGMNYPVQHNDSSESETRPMNYRADVNQNYRYGGRGYS